MSLIISLIFEVHQSNTGDYHFPPSDLGCRGSSLGWGNFSSSPISETFDPQANNHRKQGKDIHDLPLIPWEEAPGSLRPTLAHSNFVTSSHSIQTYGLKVVFYLPYLWSVHQTNTFKHLQTPLPRTNYHQDKVEDLQDYPFPPSGEASGSSLATSLTWETTLKIFFTFSHKWKHTDA